MERTLWNKPWTFDGIPLVLKKLDIREVVSDVLFNEAKVLLQIFKFPNSYMNEYVGMLIDCQIGSFVKYGESNYYGPWRAYMLIRVSLNINGPLKISTTFRRKEKDDATLNVSFKYEKLGNVLLHLWNSGAYQ